MVLAEMASGKDIIVSSMSTMSAHPSHGRAPSALSPVRLASEVMQSSFPAFLKEKVGDFVYQLALERERASQDREDKCAAVHEASKASISPMHPHDSWTGFVLPDHQQHPGRPSQGVHPSNSWAIHGAPSTIRRENSQPDSLASTRRSNRGEGQSSERESFHDVGQHKFRDYIQDILAERDSRSRRGVRGSHTSALLELPIAGHELKAKREARTLFQPDSKFRVLLELCTILALLHDSITIPFVMAWDVGDSLPIVLGMMTSLCIWTLDIFMNFTTGYYGRDGEVVMSWTKVARRYIKTTFVFDLAISGIDWFSRITEWVLGEGARGGNLAVLRLARVARLGRLVRILNVPRLVKLYTRFVSVRGAALSTTWTVILQALQILSGIVWINHLSSCVWFGLGRLVKEQSLESDTGETWLDIGVGNLDVTYYDIGMIFQYTTSMHWSMTQMTPGSMAVTPRNSLERIWNIVCLVFGLLFGTSLVGQLSSKMVQFNMSRQVETKKMEIMRRFLRENAIPPEVSHRVQRRIVERMSVKTRICEQDVEDLKHLPGNLRNQLRQMIFTPHLMKHPLFSAWKLSDATALMFVCSSGGVLFECLSTGDDAYAAHTDGDKAYFLMAGTMKYTKAEAEDPASHNEDVAAHAAASTALDVVNRGCWVCEIALWLVWQHQGTLEAQTPCEMTIIDSTAIQCLVKHCPRVESLTLDWVRALVHHVQTLKWRPFAFSGTTAPHAAEIMVHFGSIALGMSQDSRQLLATCALELTGYERNSFIHIPTINWKRDEDVELEVQDGKSVLTIDGCGQLDRTVPVVVLRIVRKDGRVLVMLARGTLLPSEVQSQRSDGTMHLGCFWHPVCKLPGKKVRVGEDPVLVLRQYIQTEMPNCIQLLAHLSDPKCYSDVKVVPSKTNIKSFYHRMIVELSLNEEDEMRLGEEMNDFEVGCLDAHPILRDMDIQIMEGTDGFAHLFSWLEPTDLASLEAGQASQITDAIKGLRGRSSLERLLTLPATRSKDLTSIIGDDPPQSVDAMEEPDVVAPALSVEVTPTAAAPAGRTLDNGVEVGTCDVKPEVVQRVSRIFKCL
mmetsp:Transcript_44056/g.101665  ORF Transcript_44056/g.101665 Transcript_44056/m.101665 type:complete len:1073 (-) Transcript_44056:174-3392(-)